METATALGPKTFLDHVLELRRRLFWVALVFVAGSSLGFLLNEPLQVLLVQPLGERLYYTSPLGGFDFLFRISLFFGSLAAIPVVVYNLIKFIEPVLGLVHKAYVVRLCVSSALLMATGVAFAYFLSLPPTLQFLVGFNSENISSLISTTEYLSFVTKYLIGFGLIFQIPLIVIVINRLTPLSPERLKKSQKYVIVGSFILAALITPTPDLLNQTIMALPMIVLYELSILWVWFSNSQQSRSLLPEESVFSFDGENEPAYSFDELATPLAEASPLARLELHETGSAATPAPHELAHAGRLHVSQLTNPRSSAADGAAAAVAGSPSIAAGKNSVQERAVLLDLRSRTAASEPPVCSPGYAALPLHFLNELS